jgi:DNA-binding MarR family transcriptional regulator
MPESAAPHDIFRPGGALAVLEPSHDPARPPPGTPDLAFPREEDIRLAQDLLFFAYRDFTNAADVFLEQFGLGRAHHRALHFIGRNPGITVSELLAILRITKQSLARVLGALLDQGYVAQAPGNLDRRQRLLTLTPAGQALERRLFEHQQARLAVAYRDAGSAAVDGFRSVMQGIMDDEARRNIAETHAAAPLGGAPSGQARPGESTPGSARAGVAPVDAMAIDHPQAGATGLGDLPTGAIGPDDSQATAMAMQDSPAGALGHADSPSAATAPADSPSAAAAPGDSPASAVRLQRMGQR